MFINKIDTRPMCGTILFIVLGIFNSVPWWYYLLVFFYFLALEWNFERVA